MSNKQALLNEIETLSSDLIDVVFRYVIFIKKDGLSIDTINEDKEIDRAFDIADGIYLSKSNAETDAVIKKCIEDQKAGTAVYYTQEEFLANLDRAIEEGAKYAQSQISP